MTTSNASMIETAQQAINAARHCWVLGLKVESIAAANLTLSLPYSPQIIGNPENGVIHGGALTTLLDTTCGFSVAIALNIFMITPTLDLRIDYMTSAKPNLTVYATAEVYRITKHVVFCRGTAYQDDISKPIAYCVATFMRPPEPSNSHPQSKPEIPHEQ
ncbi:MAG: PaaI family thioesterase [Spongiibacteraceae bacterium]